MPSPFDAIDQAGQAKIEERLGEGIRIVGLIGGEYSVRQEDPARPTQDVEAVFGESPREGAASRGIEGGSSTSSMRAHQSSEVWISAQSAAALEWRPRRDDRVILNPDGAERFYLISAVYPLVNGDMQLILSEERAQS